MSEQVKNKPITWRAPLRSNKYEKAIRETEHVVTLGWREPSGVHVSSPDEDLGAEFGWQLTPGPSGKYARLVLPGDQRRFSSVLGQEVLTRIECRKGLARYVAKADPVIAMELPKRDRWKRRTGLVREVYAHSFAERVAQRMVARSLGAALEQRFRPTLHSYRRGRDRFGALREARGLVNLGARFALQADVADFFGSIHPSLLFGCLSRTLPELQVRFMHVINAWLHASVLRRPDHSARCAGGGLVAPSRARLLQGGPLAPVLANVVGHDLIDAPFGDAYDGRVVFLRYSDNILALGWIAHEVTGAMHELRDALGTAGLLLKIAPNEAIDLHREPMRWLNKVLHGGRVRTPDDVFEAMVARIRMEDPASEAASSLLGWARTELQLDRPARYQKLLAAVRQGEDSSNATDHDAQAA